MDPSVANVGPPAASRRWNAVTFPGAQYVNAFVAFAAIDSRIMTPARAHTFVFSAEASLATIVPSPVSG